MTLEQCVLSSIDGFSPRPVIIHEWEPIAELLSNAFRWKGSKIDWHSLLIHSEQKIEFDSANIDFCVKAFIQDSGHAACFNESEKVYYVNDSSLNFAVSMEPEILLQFVIYVIHNIPQHHYFFDENAKWCVAITAEGYIDFGVRN